MAERSLLMKADGDARAGTCGKRWSTFRLKSADLSTFYRFQQLRSTAAEAIFHYSGSPTWQREGDSAWYYFFDDVYSRLGYQLLGQKAILPPPPNPFAGGNKPPWAR